MHAVDRRDGVQGLGECIATQYAGSGNWKSY